MQVLQLTPEQIDALQPSQKATIMQLVSITASMSEFSPISRSLLVLVIESSIGLLGAHCVSVGGK